MEILLAGINGTTLSRPSNNGISSYRTLGILENHRLSKFPVVSRFLFLLLNIDLTLNSGVQLIMEASLPTEQENPGNCLRPPMMREQQEARAPLLDIFSAKQQF
ncbi:hypothetical protein J6590_083693 [Homalodisca vitripennis]|nr:hypothetical protein J6590_083693 [Homalodisca vitripennis]